MRFIQAIAHTLAIDLDIFHHDGIRAVQSTPIINREGQLIGMLNNHYAQPYRPSEKQSERFHLVGIQTTALVPRKLLF